MSTLGTVTVLAFLATFILALVAQHFSTEVWDGWVERIGTALVKATMVSAVVWVFTAIVLGLTA